MRRELNLYFVFIVGLFYSSCNSGESDKYEIKNYYDLTLILDSTFDYHLHESTLLNGPGGESTLVWEFDSVNHTNIYRADSLIEGKYEFIFTTIFDKNDLFYFQLKSDSVFHLSTRIDLHPRENYSKSELYDADTICIVFVSNGCFHHYIERTICVKDRINNFYVLKTESEALITDKAHSAIISKAPESIINDIYSIQSIPQVCFIEEKLADGTMNVYVVRGFSTTRNNFYINIKNEYSAAYYLKNEYDSLIKNRYIKNGS